ncbi:DUF2267 domain-containing protein [Actinorugispora endophytica]|uniref:Uncharacterized protein (DUF2267 family) n=1 Tax=Actinorugispora endophytica TaxID=1605990 RepID=A0A4R6UGM2_9ACTN|nr:DUF2267 domain-containing protein [Actinorugispora endophytica]TDQ45980.1 uncharacterized protein (DUF2267 family) [Actinorugispora endophytica]
MSFTHIDSLDSSIHKSNKWLADICAGFATDDRRIAYRMLRAYLHTLRDRLTVDTSAHFAAQLPTLLRGVFYEGWHPAGLPHKMTRDEYVRRFARDANVRDGDVPKAVEIITRVLREHIASGAVDQAVEHLPGELRELVAPKASRS